MRSSKQEQLKYDLHKELKTKYREFFESQFAIHLLKNPDYFPSVKKISTVIKTLMETNKSVVMNVMRENPQIIKELSEPYFGSCFDSKQTVSIEEAYEKMIAMLDDKNSSLDSKMQLHCIFVHRIYDHVEKRKEKSDLVSTLFPTSLFNCKTRSRIEKKGEVGATTELGITTHPVFSKMLEQHHSNHLRALDKYTMDNSSDFSKSAFEKNIPIVCGPSGHTGSLMLGAKLYGTLTPDELKEYSLACFAFLTAGGNHSFHEVFIIANLIGVAYQIDNYSESIPESIVSATGYKNIQERFPEFLSKESRF